MGDSNRGGTMAADGRDAVPSDRVRDLDRALQLHNAVFEGSRDAIFLMQDGRFVDCNARTLEIFGCTRDEILTRRPDEFSPLAQPDGALSLEAADARMGAALAGEPQLFEWLHSRKDGTPFFAEVSLERLALGGAVFLQAIVRDITERKHSEALRSAIYEISEAAHRATNLDALFAAIHAIVGRLMDARNLYIALFDHETGTLSFPYFVDEEDAPDPPRPLGHGLTEYVLRTGRPLLVTPEVFAELRRAGEVELVGAPSVDWIGVPLVVGGQPVGVLVVQTYTEGTRYGEREKEVLAFVSREIAQAIARKRSEDTLRRGEERFRRLFQNINDAVFVHTLTPDGLPGRFTEVNDVACRRLGYTREELLRLSPPEIDAPEGAALIPHAMESLRAHGHAVWEGVHVSKDGRRIPVEISNHLFDLEGVPTILAAVRDISARKRSEERMRRLNECFLSFTSDPTANVQGMVAVCGELLGAAFAMFNRLEGDELVTVGRWNVPPEVSWKGLAAGHICTDVARGKDTGVIVHGDLPATPYAETDPGVAKLGLKTYVGKVVTCGGVPVGSLCMLYRHAFEPDEEDRKLLGIVASAVGVEDERRRALDAVRESEQLVRSVLDAMVDAVVITSVDGRVLFANPAALKLTGTVAPAAPASLDVYRFVHPDDLDAVRDNLSRIGVGNGSITARYRLRTAGGEYRLVETAGTRVRFGAEYAGLVTIRDITERTRLEEQLRQAQKMEAVGRLAGGIAHDFNNVLQALMSLSQALSGHLDDPAGFAATAAELQEQIRRGAALTRQLLLFSRRDAPRLEELDLNETVRSSSQMLRRLLRENIALEIAVSATPVTVMGDRGQLEQVMMNLAVNAADAMPTGGSLVIRTRVVEDAAVIEVADTGIGIAEDVRPRIFEPFFTTKDASRGTGLGLSVVHGIVTNHIGRIEVESEVGRGTTFRVLLPAVPGEHRPAAPAERAEAQWLTTGGRERVLVVEDEHGAREGVRQILTMLGYDVTAVGSGGEAAGLAREPGFDLLLTDQLLPDTLGTDLALRLSARWPGIKVVLMSGYTDDDNLRSRISQRQVRFLQKPFDMATLAGELRAALDEPPR